MLPETDFVAILAKRAEFKNFLAARLGGNHADAEDLLQNSLAKALHAAQGVQAQEKLVSLFYRLLRNAAIDHLRSRHAARNREDSWAREAAILNDAEAGRSICRCFESLLPSIKPLPAELLRRVELGDESVAAVASSLNLTAGNASVMLHRARQDLRRRLEDFCGPCSEKSCFDCDCDDA